MSISVEWSSPGDGLWEAANMGDLKRLKQELARPDVNLEVADNMSRTPLVEAAKYNHPECVKELLLAGADPDHVAFMGKAIDYTGNPIIKRMLSDASAAKAHGEKWVPASQPSSGGGGSHKNARSCRFYARGYCRHGSSCRFKHVGSNSGKNKAGGGTGDQKLPTVTGEPVDPSSSKVLMTGKLTLERSDDDDSGEWFPLRDSSDEFEGDSPDDELNERMEYMGFTAEEFHTLICYGVKPWDADAWDFLEQLKKEEEKYDLEMSGKTEAGEEDVKEVGGYGKELKERQCYSGFTKKEFAELNKHGVKPWDATAWDIIAALKKR